MNEPVRWVTKAEAAEELEISLSTLDRKIRTGEVEVRREGRRVYVRMEGEYITDEELLRRAMIREDELVRTVRELERSVSESEERASELERERDEARESETAAIQAYEELKEEYRKEMAERGRTRCWIVTLGLVVVALVVICSLLIWRLFA